MKLKMNVELYSFSLTVKAGVHLLHTAPCIPVETDHCSWFSLPGCVWCLRTTGIWRTKAKSKGRQ